MRGGGFGENPFDLGGRSRRRLGGGAHGAGGPPAPVARPGRTPEEVAALLRHHVEVPREDWAALRFGTRVMFEGADGEFNEGGYLEQNPCWVTVPGEEAPAPGLRLRLGAGVHGEGTLATVRYDEVGRLFIRLGIDAVLHRRAVEGAVAALNDNIASLARHLKALIRRVEALEGLEARVARLEKGRR
jgi:hypothetical protein